MKNFDLTPNGIIKTLELKRPIYFPSASYGHFGNPDLPWEKINQTLINQLKNQ
jgi:S-adenosylmethionine synthetase